METILFVLVVGGILNAVEEALAFNELQKPERIAGRRRPFGRAAKSRDWRKNQRHHANVMVDDYYAIPKWRNMISSDNRLGERILARKGKSKRAKMSEKRRIRKEEAEMWKSLEKIEAYQDHCWIEAMDNIVAQYSEFRLWRKRYLRTYSANSLNWLMEAENRMEREIARLPH